MIRKLSLLVAGALIGASTVSFVHGTIGTAAKAADTDTYRQLSIFGDVLERVRAQYVTPPDEKELIRSAIDGMLTSLDPHSTYLDPDEAQDMRVQTKGEFGGLGIEVTMENELVKVVAPIDDTPAARAGVMAGDLIEEIDGEEVRGMTLSDAVDKMRGLVNTPIELSILREGRSKPLKITIIRDIIKVKAVKHRVEGDVGYLKVTSFTEKTTDDLRAAIEDIQSQIPEEELKGYILDLRLNPGGLLDQAISVSDAFLDRGEVVSTRGREKSDIARFDSEPGDLTNGKPLVVLINGGSASASEIVAGALQDHHRATLVGTRSFGKGSVQTIIPMGENGALRLTTALYFTPSGRSIQAKGIAPDIKIEQPLPEELAEAEIEPRGESDLRGHIEGASETEEGSGSIAYVPQDPEEDVQIKYALDLLRGVEKHAAFPPEDTEKSVMKQ